MKRWQLRSESLGCRRSALTFEQGHNARRCQREFAGVHSGGVEEGGGYGPVDKPRWRQPQCLRKKVLAFATRDGCTKLGIIVRVKRRFVVCKRHQTSLLDLTMACYEPEGREFESPRAHHSNPVRPGHMGYTTYLRT
jgi:hypothetical protein